LPLDPPGFGGAFNYARYVPHNPINQADPAAEPPNPMRKTSGGTDFSPIGSAQAQTRTSCKINIEAFGWLRHRPLSETLASMRNRSG
jgi:hypothetical protein